MSVLTEPYQQPEVIDWAATTQELSQSSDRLKKTLKKYKPGGALDVLKESFERHQALQTALVGRVLAMNPELIPKSVLAQLFKSQDLLMTASAKERSLVLTPKSSLLTDSCRLTAAKQPQRAARHPMWFEWELNFSLLQQTYEYTTDPDTKELLRFFIINYLAKAAYLNQGSGCGMNEDGSDRDYADLLQIGALTFQSLYHRFNSDQISACLAASSIAGLPGEKPSSFFMLDTPSISAMYSLSFIPAPFLDQDKEIEDLLIAQFAHQLSEGELTTWERPVLLDITHQIGQLLITNNDPALQSSLSTNLAKIKMHVLKILDKAAKTIQLRYPELHLSSEAIKFHLMSNLAISSIAQVDENMSIMSIYPSFFEDKDFPEGYSASERRSYLDDKFKDWIRHTGLALGGVKFRKTLAHRLVDLPSLRQTSNGVPSKYLVSGRSDVSYYLNPADFLKTNALKDLGRLAQSPSSAQQLYALATTQMINSLFSNIPGALWEEKHLDPALRELIQTTCYRITSDIGSALLYQGDFRKFSQAIDRIHSLLTTLLAIFNPFDTDTFPQLYLRYLSSIIPADLPTTVGLAKSAMNLFAGINVIIINTNPEAVRIAMKHSYYEESELLRSTSPSLDQVLSDPDIEKVDLYIAEFNHNIDIDPLHHHYEKGNVIADIQRIFKEKPATDALTVAIDNTIDDAQSNNIALLLSTFQQEILEGKLNIIVFRSGQKFDMLGLDNYFGSPFYMINNSSAKWDAFQALQTAPMHQPDPLSLQYFTWITHTDPSLVDAYKQRIFANTRSILSLTPLSLLPDPHKQLSISTFADDVQTPFFEILIEGEEQENLRLWVQQRFMQIFTEHKKLVYIRGSFGFPHPNITWIAPKMRVNPGIDASDIPLYQQFFQELEEKLASITTSSA